VIWVFDYPGTTEIFIVALVLISVIFVFLLLRKGMDKR
jgi:hypothetical protein